MRCVVPIRNSCQVWCELLGDAPAGQNFPLTGHHHLQIDQALQRDTQATLSFSERYAHFGQGQMVAVVNPPWIATASFVG